MVRITRVGVERVTKLYGELRALHQVTVTVERGEAVALMGANGAGKSTLLNLISLQARPTRGRVLFNGEPVKATDADLLGRVGLLSHDPLVYPDLTARANLSFFAKLYGIGDADRRIDALIGSLELEDFAASRRARQLSRGQLQRVALARALLSEPDLLLLDEPAAGLDKGAIDRIEAVVRRLTGQGGMALIVTHDPEVANRIATRGIMMRRGEVVGDAPAPDTLDGWRERYLAAIRGGTR